MYESSAKDEEEVSKGSGVGRYQETLSLGSISHV